MSDKELSLEERERVREKGSIDLLTIDQIK